MYYLIQNFIVQLGPKLQSSVQVLAQSRTLYSLWYPPPTTENFLKGSRPSRRLIFDIRTSHRSSNLIRRFGLLWPTHFLPPPPKKKNPTHFLNKVNTKVFSKLNTLDLSLVWFVCFDYFCGHSLRLGCGSGEINYWIHQAQRWVKYVMGRFILADILKTFFCWKSWIHHMLRTVYKVGQKC